MDWLEAISSVISSLAWPAVVIWLGYLFREPIKGALHTIRRLKAPMIEAEFGEKLAEVDAAAEELSGSLPAPEERPAPTTPAPAPSTAAVDPSGTVIRAWTQLEGSVMSFAQGAGVEGFGDAGHWRNARNMVYLLRNRDLIDGTVANTIVSLRNLRDDVAHGRHVPTPGEALTYEGSVQDMTFYLAYRLDYLLSHGRGEDE